MELILIKDVQNLGFKDDVVTVKAGYGRNYLIPQGFAKLATPSARKVLAEDLKQRAHKEQKQIDDAKNIASQLNDIELKITAKTGGDKLFGSISSADITKALQKKGFDIDKRFVSSSLIKRVGKYNATVRLHREVVVELPFEVIAENK